jgi:hypothetical protein
VDVGHPDGRVVRARRAQDPRDRPVPEGRRERGRHDDDSGDGRRVDEAMSGLPDDTRGDDEDADGVEQVGEPQEVAGETGAHAVREEKTRQRGLVGEVVRGVREQPEATTADPARDLESEDACVEGGRDGQGLAKMRHERRLAGSAAARDAERFAGQRRPQYAM